MQIEFELPIPPSGNHRLCWGKKGFYKSVQYKVYLHQSQYLLKGLKRPLWSEKSKLGIRICVYPKNARITDLDNQVKVALDAIQLHLGINDAWYWHMEIDRGSITKPEGKLAIQIWELEDC